MSDLTVVDGGAGRAETGYQLLDSDPRRLGQIRLVRRMRESSDPLDHDDKPFPFLGRVRPRTAGSEEPFLIVKVARTPVGQLVERCLSEEEDWARATGRLHSVGNDAHYRWVARQYIPGTPLHRLPAETSPEQRALYAHWLLSEIHQWHTRHRESHLDIKPSNVIVTDERAVLIDFETSVNHGSQHSFNGLATAAFASPEQVFSRAGHPIGMPSDVFAWAVTVFSMFRRDMHPYCGGPFDLRRFADIDDRVSAGGKAPDPDVSAIPSMGLREAVARALAWEPEKRPSAGELIELLNRTEPMLLIKRLPLTEVQPPVTSVAPAAPVARLRWWLSPAGPLGDRHVDSYAQLVALVGAGTVGLLVGLVLALLLGGALGA